MDFSKMTVAEAKKLEAELSDFIRKQSKKENRNVEKCLNLALKKVKADGLIDKVESRSVINKSVNVNYSITCFVNINGNVDVDYAVEGNAWDQLDSKQFRKELLEECNVQKSAINGKEIIKKIKDIAKEYDVEFEDLWNKICSLL